LVRGRKEKREKERGDGKKSEGHARARAHPGPLFPHAFFFTFPTDETMAAGSSTFIMCMTGTSRSPAIAAAWLWLRGGAPSVEAALTECAAARPGVALTETATERLREFVGLHGGTPSGA